MIKQILTPLSFDKSHELIKLLDEKIKANLEPYKQQIENLKEDGFKLKDNLVEYFIIGKLDNKYCHPHVSNDLPEWLSQYLYDCYVLVHNHLASAKD
jgi:uncharacterized protein YdcH (DUF465 family)